MAINNATIGLSPLNANDGEFSRMEAMIRQLLGLLQTATLVRVDNCSNNGGLSPVGTVDVTPLVNQTDTTGESVPHTTIFNIPYFRLQGGANAIIIDPEPGDIGICVFASRDLSKVKESKIQSPPGSRRQFSFSDGLYIGGVLNPIPPQSIRFGSDGVTITSPIGITLNTPTVNINGDAIISKDISVSGGVSVSKDASVSGNITGGASGISLTTHTHPDPQGGNTGEPNP